MWFLVVLSLTGEMVQLQGPMRKTSCDKRLKAYEGRISTHYRIACIRSLKEGMQYELGNENRIRNGTANDRS